MKIQQAFKYQSLPTWNQEPSMGFFTTRRPWLSNHCSGRYCRMPHGCSPKNGCIGKAVGYTHYWDRETEVDPQLFRRMVSDFQRLVLPLEEAGAPLAGPWGSELPEIACWPIPGSYDLAVQCALLITKHYLGDRIDVHPGDFDFQWNDPRRLCYVHLGYPLNEFRKDRERGLIPART